MPPHFFKKREIVTKEVYLCVLLDVHPNVTSLRTVIETLQTENRGRHSS
ncbi:hypothetical protein ALC62_10877 [Cyphomyrmex costatus]|uniref:Uncharacterized protein n=1 Tax=Cyphomyrmex costatus TaxID=456900 RepID=A0A151IDC2_9HYME|nr:hypothetical protein ALC62_10877 [Cyphomyrmex costatus]